MADFRARNIAVMANFSGPGCVVSVNGVGRRYEDMAPPEGVVSLCWDRGEGVLTGSDGGIRPFTAFDTLAPYLDRWAADQAAADEKREAELQAQIREIRVKREALERENRRQLDQIIDERIDERASENG